MGVMSGVFAQPPLVCAMAAIPVGAVAASVRMWELKRKQRVRDNDAADILNRLERGEKPRFSLYLRTFGVTGNLPLEQSSEAERLLFGQPHLDFERLLAHAAESDAPLVALGKPEEHVGAGRILTDDATWEQKILRLAEHAVNIFVIPSSRPGTAWEIDMIVCNGLWSKTVFLMPPALSEPLARAWDADRDRLAAAGVTIQSTLMAEWPLPWTSVGRCVAEPNSP